MMTKNKLRRILILVLLATISTALTCSDHCPKPHNITAAQLRKEEAPAQAPPTSDQLVVYLDTSASMAGYLPEDQTTETSYGRTLRELRNFVTLITPPLNVLVRRVDVRVGDALKDMTLSHASIDKKLFDGKDTDLAGTFEQFQKATAASDVGPPRFHVLVTDGVQSTTGDRPDTACTTGSDQLCVRKKIASLLDSGWGGCIIGLRSEFHGNIYSEVNRARGRPSALRFDSETGQPKSFRPFYLYVFSPDRALVEQFVATLVRRLKPLIGEDGDSLRVLPLTLKYAADQSKVEYSVPKASAKLLGVRREGNKELPEFTVTVDPSTAQGGAQPFTLAFTVPWSQNVLLSGSARELAELIRWDLVPVYPESPNPKSRYPEVKIVRKQVNDDGQIVLQATAEWPTAVGDLCWRGYRLEGRLQPEALAPQWVSDWSADLDTTTETGNRTLYLESGLLGLWRNPVVSNQLVAEASLIVGKR